MRVTDLQQLQSSGRIGFVIASLPFCRLLRLVEAPAVDRILLLVPCCWEFVHVLISGHGGSLRSQANCTVVLTDSMASSCHFDHLYPFFTLLRTFALFACVCVTCGPL